ncbi:MAG: glycosyltransferase [Pseudomonadota bacterium]
MKSSFQYLRYAEANADLAERFGTDEVELQAHFDRFGKTEMRGVQSEDYMRLEGVICSDRGHIYLAGWADRRLISAFYVTLEVGFMSYDLGLVEPCWYHRGDVAGVTGDTQMPAGFLTVLHVPGMTLHAQVRVLVNGKVMYEEPVMRWKSVDTFLNQALGACAVLSDQPVGISQRHAHALYPVFADLWLEFAEGLRFTKVFENGADRDIARSIIITIYRKPDMLLVQLDCLAEALLADGQTEVIVVGNDMVGAERLVEELDAFCQIHDIPLSVHLCSGNSGFSIGNNYGADQARGEILIFMNPDIFPPETAPERATDFLFTDPGTDLHGALLYYGDGTLMHSGMYTTGDLAFDAKSGLSEQVLRVEHFGKGLTHHIDDDPALIAPALEEIQNQPVLASAALWKLRKEVFDAVGQLPVDYLFAYYEDADFCLALRQAGHDIRIDPDSRWIHMEGVGKPKAPSVRAFMWLNRAHYSQKFADTPLVAGRDVDLFLL